VPRPGLSRLDSLKQGFFLLSSTGWFAHNALQAVFVASVLGCVGLLVMKFAQRRTTSEDIGIALIAVIALAGTIQAYPTYDSRHLWWGLPLALAVAMSTFGARFHNVRHFYLMLVLVATPVLVSALLTGRSVLNEPRVPHTSSGLLSGMLGTADEVIFENEVRNFIARRVTQPAIFLSPNGGLAIASGTFGSIDPYFIDWSKSTPLLVERVRERPEIVSDRDLPILIQATGGTDYFVASRNSNLIHLLAPPCIAGNCSGIEPNDVCMSWGSCRPRSTPEPLELVPDSSFNPVTPWTDWNVKVNAGFSYPEDDGAWITGRHARLTFDNVPTDAVRVSLYPFLPPEWTHIDINILTDSEATPIRLNNGVTTIDLPVKANTWNELVFRCDTLHRPSDLGLSADERPLCAKILGFEPIT
jgi:hypothetical protein